MPPLGRVAWTSCSSSTTPRSTRPRHDPRPLAPGTRADRRGQPAFTYDEPLAPQPADRLLAVAGVHHPPRIGARGREVAHLDDVVDHLLQLVCRQTEVAL